MPETVEVRRRSDPAQRGRPPLDTSRERTVGAILAPLGLRGPTYLHALESAQADPARLANLWLEIGEALATLGRIDKARYAWLNGLGAAETAGLRALTASFYWRLAQLAEATRELTDALGWYEKAAAVFVREGAKADEAVTRMALARVSLYANGAGVARQLTRDAVISAREAGDPALFARALELTGEVSFELGTLDEAISSMRDAMRLYDEQGDEMARTQVAVSLADALLETGQSLPALAALEVAMPFLESHESLEVRGRGIGLLGLVNIDVGDYESALEPLRKAHEWLEMANAPLRRARLLVATARRIQTRLGAAHAKTLYDQAWKLAQHQGEGEKFKLAPIAFALARCQFETGDLVRADDTITIALTLVNEAGDLEGLSRCTELGVRIAAKLKAGGVALERLLTLARAQARLGALSPALRTLRYALDATINIPEGDVGIVSAEYMDIVRQRGIAILGPTEAIETAEVLAKAGYPHFASELATMDAERQLANNRLGDAAKTLARAANWSAIAFHETDNADHNAEALVLWDRSIELAEHVGLAEVDNWRTERTIVAES